MNHPSPEKVQNAASFRWFVLAALLATQFAIQSALYGPAATAVQIRQHLAITNAQFGFAMGSANIATTLSVIFSSLLIDRIGIAHTFSVGLALLGLGGVELMFVHHQSLLLSARLIEGIAIGIIYPAAAALIMEWFPTNELALINTSFIASAFISTGIAYLATAGLLRLGASWNAALAVYGLAALVLCGLWMLFSGRKRQCQGKANLLPASRPQERSLVKAARMPVIWLLGIGLFAARSVAEMYLFFLPLYLQRERQVVQAHAAQIASILPFASVAGVLIFGFLARKASLRRPLLQGSAAVVLLGSLISTFGSGVALSWGLGIIGCGIAGIQPVQSTYVMSLPKITPSIVAAFFVITNLLTHIGGFITPVAAGRLSETSLGLRYTLFLFSLLEVIGLIALFFVPPAGEKANAILEDIP